MKKRKYLSGSQAQPMLREMGYTNKACATCTHFDDDVDFIEDDDDGDDPKAFCTVNRVHLEVKGNGSGRCDEHHLKVEKPLVEE